VLAGFALHALLCVLAAAARAHTHTHTYTHTCVTVWHSEHCTLWAPRGNASSTRQPLHTVCAWLGSGGGAGGAAVMWPQREQRTLLAPCCGCGREGLLVECCEQVRTQEVPRVKAPGTPAPPQQQQTTLLSPPLATPEDTSAASDNRRMSGGCVVPAGWLLMVGVVGGRERRVGEGAAGRQRQQQRLLQAAAGETPPTPHRRLPIDCQRDHLVLAACKGTASCSEGAALKETLTVSECCGSGSTRFHNR